MRTIVGCESQTNKLSLFKQINNGSYGKKQQQNSSRLLSK